MLDDEQSGWPDLLVANDTQPNKFYRNQRNGTFRDAAVEAVRVGSDLLLICHHPEPILNVYEALIDEGERSTAFGRLLQARARESQRKRAKTFRAGMPAALSKREFEALRARILRFGEKVRSRGRSGSVVSRPFVRSGERMDGAPETHG